MNTLLKKPSAWLPIACSLGLMLMLGLTFARGKLSPQPDEGIEAHIFQLWLVIEVVMIGFFAVKWLPQAAQNAYLVLFIQIVAVLLACTPVFYLHL